MKNFILIVILILTSCSNDEDCIKYPIPKTELNAFNFLGEKDVKFIYKKINDSLQTSDTFYLSGIQEYFSNSDCNQFELGTNQNEYKFLGFNSTNFQVNPIKNRKHIFEYGIFQSSYEENTTIHYFVLGKLKSYHFALDTLDQIKLSKNKTTPFIKSKVDSVAVFSNNKSSSFTGKDKEYISSAFWSEKIGLVGYEIRNESTFILDTILK